MAAQGKLCFRTDGQTATARDIRERLVNECAWPDKASEVDEDPHPGLLPNSRKQPARRTGAFAQVWDAL